MTKVQYEILKADIEARGYTLYKERATIQNESFYYGKGFAYPDTRRAQPSYHVIFLVWDYTGYRNIEKTSMYGVTPLIMTETKKWPRIDLSITTDETDNIDVEEIERFAHDFYHNFLIGREAKKER